MTLLQLINRLFNLSREEELTTLPASDVRIEAAIGLINQAKDLILGGMDWNFNHKRDGSVEFLAPVSGTGLTVTADTAIALLTGTLTIAGVPKLRISEIDGAGTASTYPNSVYRVVSYDSTTTPGFTTLTLHTTLPDAVAGTGAWRLMFHEQALPSNVARVTSIRDEEHPLQLYFEDDEIDFDMLEPRYADTEARPDIAVVSGTAVNAYNAATASELAASDAGVRLLVWPVPSTRTQLFYSYVQRLDDLAEEKDYWPAVPQEVLTLVVQGAYELSLMSTVEQDDRRGAFFSTQLERNIRRVHHRHRPDPMRRSIPRPFGSRVARDPFRRWATRTVPTP